MRAERKALWRDSGTEPEAGKSTDKELLAIGLNRNTIWRKKIS